MSGHISKVAAARYESPLKGLYKYYHIPGMGTSLLVTSAPYRFG